MKACPVSMRLMLKPVAFWSASSGRTAIKSSLSTGFRHILPADSLFNIRPDARKSWRERYSMRSMQANHRRKTMAATKFRLLMLSAMYENGGNTTHRLLDGHPQMFVYPFESQVGSRLVMDHLTSMFPVKYRWPVFNLSASPYQDYKAIIDEECKVRAITPQVSKFRHMPFDLNDDKRLELFTSYLSKTERNRGNIMTAFFQATFDAWKDYRRTGEEQVYV